MTQFGFYIDANNCSGCRTCMAACKDVNDLGLYETFRWVESYCTGEFPEARMYHVAVTCNHCGDPACVKACPTGAMYKQEETGLVCHDDEMCIGCETCVKSCPYGHPTLIESLGIVKKCEACAGLRIQGELPACVASCPMRAIEFGDIEELRAKHEAEGLTADMAVLPSSSQTTPNVAYRIKECMLDEDYDRIIL